MNIHTRAYGRLVAATLAITTSVAIATVSAPAYAATPRTADGVAVPAGLSQVQVQWAAQLEHQRAIHGLRKLPIVACVPAVTPHIAEQAPSSAQAIREVMVDSGLLPGTASPDRAMVLDPKAKYVGVEVVASPSPVESTYLASVSTKVWSCVH